MGEHFGHAPPAAFVSLMLCDIFLFLGKRVCSRNLALDSWRSMPSPWCRFLLLSVPPTPPPTRNMESSCEPPDLEDDERSWTGRQVRQVLQETLAAHRRDLDRVRTFWMEQFAEFRWVRDAAAKAALKAIEDDWSRRWARREDDIFQDLQAMRESVRLHVEEHWDNMEWHLDRTVDDCERELRCVKAVMEQKEKELQLSQQKELNAGVLASLEEKKAQMGNVKDVLLLLKSRLEEKEEQKEQLQQLLVSVGRQLRQERQESARWRTCADELRQCLEAEREAGAQARMEALRRQQRLLQRVDNVKSLVKGFVGQNARFMRSLKCADDTADQNEMMDQAEKGQVGEKERREEKERRAKEKKESKEREKRAKKEKKERDKREKQASKECQRKEKKEKE
ncbi:calponin homology domain-containing protein DDB_G0272472-like isoform X2 [Hippocampus zosterae]|uniref:calponin homology domain-containing protein DDB_G0272472-like isoform X2 n=1 Tax=Hippocampus zosterae TaxID=109293 RepID=UPI00223D535B|nr:calponin homology domain-containing protein DDB_G0272472-like isoform X2 [Hippocampus zosterae]